MKFTMILLALSISVCAFSQTLKPGDSLRVNLTNLENRLSVDDDDTFIKTPETLELSFRLSLCGKEVFIHSPLVGKPYLALACETNPERMAVVKNITIPVSTGSLDDISVEIPFQELEAMLSSIEGTYADVDASLEVDLGMDDTVIQIEVFEVDHSIFGERYDNIATSSYFDGGRAVGGKSESRFSSRHIEGDVSVSAVTE